MGETIARLRGQAVAPGLSGAAVLATAVAECRPPAGLTCERVAWAHAIAEAQAVYARSDTPGGPVMVPTVDVATGPACGLGFPHSPG